MSEEDRRRLMALRGMSVDAEPEPVQRRPMTEAEERLLEACMSIRPDDWRSEESKAFESARLALQIEQTKQSDIENWIDAKETYDRAYARLVVAKQLVAQPIREKLAEERGWDMRWI